MITPTPIKIQTAPPKGTFPGAIAEAFFVVDNDRVILADKNGHAVHDPEGRDYTRALSKGDEPRQVAAQLLRSFRTKVRGDRVAGFEPGQRLNYQPLKY